jgi:hypothetical protein
MKFLISFCCPSRTRGIMDEIPIIKNKRNRTFRDFILAISAIGAQYYLTFSKDKSKNN